MICLFPDPHPDELLYSVCARYSDLIEYPNRTTATNDFFGDDQVSAVVDLPNRLNYLEAALPPNHLYTIDEFIDDNTHFPLYAPFLSPERARIVRSEMRGNGDNHIQERLGISACRIPKQDWLRFCPECVAYDKQEWNETYWHRIHQISGIDVCPEHALFLEESTVRRHNSRNSGAAFSAESAVHNTLARPINLSDRNHKIKLDIARSAAWLLKWRGEPLGRQVLRERYYNSLLRQGLAYYNGQIRTSLLVSKFLEFYPKEILVGLGCEIKRPHTSWLMRLLYSSKTEVTHHPLRHILLILFLGYTVEEFFNSFTEYKPFGEGPWPCLNQASGHYKQPEVTTCRVNDGVKKNLGKPVGIFSCTCGFVYTRTGPDRTEDDRFSSTSVQDYGHVWEGVLKELWEDPSITMREISHKLGVNELTVKRRAIYLELTFPRHLRDSSIADKEINTRYKIVRKSPREILEKRRQKLLKLIQDNPQAGRTELQNLAPYLIDWLRQNDAVWIESHLPPAIKNKPRPVCINWAAEDNKLAEAIKEAALSIRMMEPPVRASLSEIIRRVGNRSWIERDLGKLPLTNENLKLYVESTEDFLIRKIEYIADYFYKERIVPSRSTLESRAGIKDRQAGKTAKVQKALAAALTKLSKNSPFEDPIH